MNVSVRDFRNLPECLSLSVVRVDSQWIELIVINIKFNYVMNVSFCLFLLYSDIHREREGSEKYVLLIL